MTYLAFLLLIAIPIRWFSINRDLLTMNLRDAISNYSGREERVKRAGQLLLLIFIIGMGALIFFTI
jgi:hypothetical protein